MKFGEWAKFKIDGKGFETRGDNPVGDTDPYITPYENVIGVYIMTLPF